MKIIARIIPRGDRKWVARCDHCGAVIEAKESELSVNEDRDGRHAKHACIGCGQEVLFYPRAR